MSSVCINTKDIFVHHGLAFIFTLTCDIFLTHNTLIKDWRNYHAE